MCCGPGLLLSASKLISLCIFRRLRCKNEPMIPSTSAEYAAGTGQARQRVRGRPRKDRGMQSGSSTRHYHTVCLVSQEGTCRVIWLPKEAGTPLRNRLGEIEGGSRCLSCVSMWTRRREGAFRQGLEARKSLRHSSQELK